MALRALYGPLPFSVVFAAVEAFKPSLMRRTIAPRKTSSSSLMMGVGKEAKRAWTKGDLGEGADMFDDTEDDAMADVKKKFKLDPGLELSSHSIPVHLMYCIVHPRYR